MDTIEQHEIPFEGKRHRNPKRRRGIFLLPAMMTSANLLCGYYAVVAALIGGPEDLNRAAKAIGLAILFDSLDGRLARMTGTTTEFGVQFDSLADVVSFGIAPVDSRLCVGISQRHQHGRRRAASARPVCLGLLSRVFDLLRMEASAVQRPGNGAGQLEVFCRHANSSSGRGDCLHRPWASLGRANVDRTATKRLVGYKLVHPHRGAGRR